MNIYPMKLQQKENSKEIKECTICLDDIGLKSGENVTKTICNHYFHKQCLSGWIDGEKKETCPNCRAKIKVHEKKHNKGCIYKLGGIVVTVFGIAFLCSILCFLREPIIDQAGKYF